MIDIKEHFKMMRKLKGFEEFVYNSMSEGIHLDFDDEESFLVVALETFLGLEEENRSDEEDHNDFMKNR